MKTSTNSLRCFSFHQAPIYRCYGCCFNYHAECNILNYRVIAPAEIVRHNRFRCANCDLSKTTNRSIPIARRPKITAKLIPSICNRNHPTGNTKSRASNADSTSPLWNSGEMQEEEKEAIPYTNAPSSVSSSADMSASLPNADSDDSVIIIDDILHIDEKRVREFNTTKLIGKLTDRQCSVQTKPSPPGRNRASIDQALQRAFDSSSPTTSVESDAPVHTQCRTSCDKRPEQTEEFWSPYGPCADDIVPDASNWTVDQVHSYFNKCLPAAANVLREEKVDGLALLLLTRSDVLALPGISMGARLNMYTHCVRLQTRSNNVFMAFG